jgi:hypothetical protein
MRIQVAGEDLKRCEDGIQGGDDVRQSAAEIQIAQESAEERAWLGSDIQHHLIQMNHQTEHVRIERVPEGYSSLRADIGSIRAAR